MLLNYDVPLIGADSLAQLNERAIFDARNAEEFNVSHIAGAVHIEPTGPLPGWLDSLPRDQQITVYCSVGYRSENVARRLQTAGFTKVNNLYGSIFDWVDRGYPVVDSSGQPTNRIHTYNKRWGKLITSPTAKKVW